MQSFVRLANQRLEALLAAMPQTRVAVVGDYCLDIYWFVDPERSEPSVETGLATRPVRRQRQALGGAGNVVANLVALGCRQVAALGVVGDDPWGREQLRLLEGLGVDTTGLGVQADDWSTLAYLKPHLDRQEQNRLDFGNYNRLAEPTADRLLDHCRKCFANADVVVVNQQVRQGLHNDRLRAGLAELIGQFPACRFIVDSRHCADAYPGALLKLNEHEAARLCQISHPADQGLRREQALQAADSLYQRQGRPVLLTRGRRGLIVRDDTGLGEIPGLQISGRIDPVGAGDSVLAGFALALAAGGSPAEAAQIGNLVAGVTIQKIDQTGTATPAEVLAIGRDGAYVYQPELAEDPRRARHLAGSECEIVTDLPAATIVAAVFDHDGTISTLREGWEQVMEPMMVQAILGPRYAEADEPLYLRVVDRVRQFIDDTTGIQTLEQMHGLAAMVREFGCVPEAEILDPAGYKRLYNDALTRVVRERLAKLERGELEVADFTIKNAVPFLHALHEAGVPLYLASGTDQDDVLAEATALGYAHLFADGIHGALGGEAPDAKRRVLERLLEEIDAPDKHALVVFGDGPVELREARRRGGYAIGLATDEVRRFGLNPSKRTRLIRAGADLLIPDFSQFHLLLPRLGIPLPNQ